MLDLATQPPSPGPASDPGLVSLVDEEPRGIAQRIVRGKCDERPPRATGLVHGSIARLLASEGPAPGAEPPRALTRITRAIGRVQIDRDVELKSFERAGLRRRVPLADVLAVVAPPDGPIETLHGAIRRLGAGLGRLVLLHDRVGTPDEGIPRAVEAGLQSARAQRHGGPPGGAGER